MKPNTQIGVNLKLLAGDPSEIDFLDNLSIDKAYINDTLSPYLKDLYTELVSKSSNSAKGIYKVVFLEVFLFLYFLVCQSSWIDWGTLI